MPFNISFPTITAETEREKINQLSRYIFQLVEQLNFSLNTLDDNIVYSSDQKTIVVPQPSQVATIDPAVLEKAVSDQIEENRVSLRDFIINSADFVTQVGDAWDKTYAGTYVAQSDFGSYKEDTKRSISENSEYVEQLFTRTASVVSDSDEFTVSSQARIKTGLLWTDSDDQAVYGIGIGMVSQTDNGTPVLSRKSLAATFTADEIAFWQGDEQIASISPESVWFPNGVLQAYGAKFDEATIENATIENATIINSHLDTVSIVNAVVTGNITATEGNIGGCKIVDGKLEVPYANITGELQIGEKVEEILENGGYQSANDIKADIESMGYQTETGVTTIIDGRITTDYLNAKGIKAGSIDVVSAKGQSLLSVDSATNLVQIGGFAVFADGFRSINGKEGIYEGTTTEGNYATGVSGYMFVCFSVTSGVTYLVTEDPYGNNISKEFVTIKPYINYNPPIQT